jgi:ABC-type polysaccharide/polyol phosphate transport system ATPase subunit
MAHPQLTPGIVVSVEGVSKAPPRPMPQPPRWLARVLPGVKWSARGQDAEGDIVDPEDDEDDMDDEELGRRAMPLKEVSFEIAAGRGLGLVGPDLEAARTLCLILTGYLPPTTGRILVRAGVAPIFTSADLNLSRLYGKRAINLVARFLRWDLDLIRDRWSDIERFARLEQIDFPKDSIEYDGAMTKRLLLATALHLDAGLYIVARNFYGSDPEFTAHCYERIQERVNEGAAVLQTGLEVDDVSRFCQEAMWFEKGRVEFRGRLSEVAKAVSEQEVTDEVRLMTRVPLRASLLDEDDQQIGPQGGTIDIELDAFSKNLEVALAIVFTDERGHETRVEHPDLFAPEEPGIYRLRMAIPGGLLDDGTYRAVLYAAAPSLGWDASHRLLSFTVVSEGFSTTEEAYELGHDSMVMPDIEIDVEPADVEWSIHRT